MGAVSWGQSGKVLVIGLYPQPVADTLARLSRPEAAEKGLFDAFLDAAFERVVVET